MQASPTIGDRDENPASPTSEAGVSEPAPSNVSRSDNQPHDASMEKPFTSPNILRGATNWDSSYARSEHIESEPTEVQQKEAAERETADQPELEGFPDPQERGIVSTLYEASSQNFKALLKLAKASRSPQASNTSGPTITAKNLGNTGLSSPSNSAELSQVESLQRDFIRFNVWGEEFDVAGGKLDEGLEYSEGLKEDLILVLLHLCDALYQGLPYLTTRPDTTEGTEQLGTVRLLEIAQSYIEENVYLGIDGTSFANIVDEVSIATEGLGDLSFCLEVPAVDLFAVLETPRAPSEVTAAESHRVYEEMIRHRFPKADPIAISQHATANYFRFITLQNLRREAEEEAPESECDGAGHSPAAFPVKEETQTVTRTMFHDSGIGTSHRHESSYAKSLMSFTKRTEEQYTKFLPKLPEAGALGRQFDCSVCLRKVQFRNENVWTTHVIEDLLPYVCVFHGCLKSTEPFENRTLWLNHLKDLHGMNMDGIDMICNLCKEVVSSGHVSQIAHVESHLIEIALSVMPTDGDPDPEEVKLAETYPPEYRVPRSPDAYQTDLPLITYIPSQGHVDFDSKRVALEEAYPYGFGNMGFATDQHNNEPMGKAESLLADDGSEDDSDYKLRTGKRRSGLVSNAKAAGRVTRIGRRRNDRLPRKYDGPVTRPFLCPLAFYGCQSSFSSKNEWKRHVATQHIRQGFWRCDLCATTVDPADDRTVYHNDFNRKDLFAQHLRRMHAHNPMNSTAKGIVPVTEENLANHLQRCFQKIRMPPSQSSCLFCDCSFTGPNSWEERLEHVSRHLEKDAKTGTFSLYSKHWRNDPELEKYLLGEGLIARGQDGDWRIGDGTPLRLKIAQGNGADEDAEADPDD